MSAMRHERDTSKERNKESLLIHCTQLAPADSRRMLTTWSAMFVDHNSFLVLDANFVHTSMSNISEHGNAKHQYKKLRGATSHTYACDKCGRLDSYINVSI